MKITVFHFEKSIGLFFQEWGSRLKDDIKTDRILSFILALPLSLWGIITMANLGSQIIFIILMTAIIMALFFGVFLALFKFIGVALISLGKFFTNQSQTARFSAKIIDQSQKDSRDKKYAVQIVNREWFSDCENVSCRIGLVGRSLDYDDLHILKTFDKLPKNNFYPGAGGSGIWADNDGAKINIPRNSKKLLKFIKVSFLDDKFYVSLTDYGKDKLVEIPSEVGKHLFLINISGEIKDGNIDCNFKIKVVYKSKNDIELEIENEHIAVGVSKRKQETAGYVWS